jgi:hypothetical protein
MSIFIVTFRFEFDDNYDERYDTFVKELRNVKLYWEEPTSFFVVDTSETIDAFCDRIYYKSLFDEDKDLFVVIESGNKVGRIRGKVHDQTISTLMPYLKKL